MTVGDPGPTSVMLSWEALPGVIHYNVSFERSPVERSQDHRTQCERFLHEDTIDVGTATEYTLEDLEEDSIYTITVTAVYTGRSASSEPQVITTLQAGKININSNSQSDTLYHNPFSSSFSPLCSSSECQKHKYQFNYYHCCMGSC